MWICVFNETDTRFCLCQDTGTMNRPLRLAGCFATHFVGVRNVIAIRLQCYWQFVSNILAIRSQCFGNPSATFWQSVRNVLAIRQQCFGNPFAMFWQSVSNVLANRSQCFGNPSAMFWQTVRSRRGRFIVPAYMKTPTK